MSGRWYWSAILDRFDLSDAAMRTYLCLCRFEKDGVCNPSLRRQADAMHTDRSRVAKSLKELERAGAIRRDSGDPSGWATTTYTLLVWAETTVPATPERKEPRLSGVEQDTTSDPQVVSKSALSGVERTAQVVSKSALSGVAVDTQTTGTTNTEQREQRAATVEPLGFADFWMLYPRKLDRARAAVAFKKAVKADGLGAIGEGLAAWLGYWRGNGTEERFVPHATTWLNQQRWRDSPPSGRVGGGRAGAGGSLDLIEKAALAAKKAGR